MNDNLSSARRRGGAACLAGAALTVAGSAAIAVLSADTTVSDGLFRYPLSKPAFVAFAVFAAVTHALVGAGVLGLGRSGVLGAGRVAGRAVSTVLAGTVLLFVCEWATIPLVAARESAPGATAVDSLFGLATLLVTGGMLVAGWSSRRAARWTGWRRLAPLSCGLLSLVVIPVQFTDASWLGIGIYGVGYAVLGVAMVTDARPAVAGALARS